jgi:hypothetical protein
MDTGACSVTLASGELESIEMNFAVTGSGSFSSQRSKDGVPSGASAGTFRKVIDSSLTIVMPSTLGHERITISSNGRPVSIEVKTDGTASSTGPVGVVTVPFTYILKTGSTSELRLNGTPDSAIYSLSFTGPYCGTYSCKAKKGSVLRREATGSFTIATQP